MVEAHMKSKSHDLRNHCEPSMPKNIRHLNDSGFLKKAELLKLKMKAMRSGVWFKALPRIDRVLVDLTIRVAGTVRSFTLAEKILSVVRKLESLLENKLQRAAREIGLPIARKLSLFAQEWGNVAAKNWVSDGCFARYWAAVSLNDHKFFSG
jgi:nicotinic acid phosphoribosyltransferase